MKTGSLTRKRASMVGGLLAACVSVAHAKDVEHPEGKESVLSAVKVTATRSQVELEDSPRSIIVLDSEQMEAKPAKSGIQEILASLPGVSFARSGGIGGQIVMRGFNSNTARSVLAIDGDRFRGRSTLEFNMIDPNCVERIEVVRGPASAIWGADAMNGVVNVVTRRAHVGLEEPFHLDAKLRALEYSSASNLLAGRAELLGGGKGFDVMLGANYRKADDYRTPQGRAENSAFTAGGSDLRLGYSPNSDVRWELAARYQHTESGRSGGLGAAPGAPYMRVNEDPIVEKFLKLGVEARRLGALADRLEANINVRRLETDIFQANATNASGTLAATTTYQHIRVYSPTVWGGRINAMKSLGNHNLSYGLDGFREGFDGRRVQVSTRNTATGVLLTQAAERSMERSSEQTNIGAFVSDDWQISKAFSLSAALRWDWFRTEIDSVPVAGESALLTQTLNANRLTHSTPITGSLGAVYAFSGQWRVFTQLSQGFRVPSGLERASTSTAGTVVTLPSPDLQSEKSITTEAGVRYAGQSFSFNLSAYRSDYRDLIILAVVNSTTRQRRNTGRAEIKGLELDGSWQMSPEWSARFSLAATHGTDITNAVPLESIPPLGGQFAIRYTRPSGAWSIESLLKANDSRDRVNPSTERPRPGSGRVDVLASADLGKVVSRRFQGWRLTTGIENILDQTSVNPVSAEDLRYPSGLTGNPLIEPGRSFVLRLSIN